MQPGIVETKFINAVPQNSLRINHFPNFTPISSQYHCCSIYTRFAPAINRRASLCLIQRMLGGRGHAAFRMSSRPKNEPLTSLIERLGRPSTHKPATLETSPTLLARGSFRCCCSGGGTVARSLRVPRRRGSTFPLRERNQFLVWRARPRCAGGRPVLTRIRLLLRAASL